MALNVINKLGFIDGTIPKAPLDHPDSDAWSRVNDIVITWLIRSVSKKIGQSLLYMSTAEKIWKNLITRYKQDDAPRVYEIEQRLGSIQQGAMDLQQRSRVTKFLMGLNVSYEQTRRHILMLKLIPNIEEAYNIFGQDEHQRVVKPVIKNESVAFQATSSFVDNQSYMQNQMEYAAAYNTYRPRGNRLLCTHCGKLGHTIQTCFKLHGYPPGYKPPNSVNTGSS
ncbi:PREDICTED: uncharacterized protein LOC104708315 [Camelina sativa]|uniref:Uncharacterized protein LOC104708315 n=1 Tax=Camelina sativa TaxID=90675 RepID=A0ABM0TA56_CAMSA|nr:PREDICTED: uncharacterized protein LOC104708315 [Camelina sativa]